MQEDTFWVNARPTCVTTNQVFAATRVRLTVAHEPSTNPKQTPALVNVCGWADSQPNQKQPHPHQAPHSAP